MGAPISRLGFKYVAEDDQFSHQALVRRLHQLSAGWVVIPISSGELVPEDFIRGLIERGVRPIPWIRTAIDAVSVEQIAPDLAVYAEWGVREIVVFDRPNHKSGWTSEAWARAGLVERFVDQMLPILQFQNAAGMNPMLPPLHPGGDYWDTAFLESTLRSMMRRGHRSLVDSLRLASYAWTLGKPLDWGAGGPARWPNSLPYHTVDSSQDQIGFRALDWYAATTESVLGAALPMIVISAGPGEGQEPSREVIEGMVRALNNGEIPETVLSFNIDSQGSDLALPPIPVQSEKVVKSAAPRALRHFVLLPDGPILKDTWATVKTLAKDGVFGTSPDEAMQASRVTLLGNETEISPAVERQLIQGGCEVNRVTGPTELVVAAWKATYGD